MRVEEGEGRTVSVQGLDPGTKYNLRVMAKNTHGRSNPLYLQVETFLAPSELIAETKVKEDISTNDGDISAVPVIVTCLVVIVTAMILLMIFLRLRSRNPLTSPVVSMTLLHTNISTEQQNLTDNIHSQDTFHYCAQAQGNNQVSAS